jgi:RNA polymerase sigma factor (sigma-70 family)
VRAGGVQGRVPLRDDDPERRVAAIMAKHGRLLLHVAYQWSICHDDALDAYQRGLEIFLRRADTVEPATEVAWLKVVVKHEALAIRRARQNSVADEEPDLDAQVPPSQRSLEEQIEGGERISRSAEALRALKPDEAKALMLKAEGHSYAEIGERFGWTYTKVNRAITEGRKRFLKAYRAIEAGEECERFAPILASLARGQATSAEIVEVRPHLRHCTACRATVRELHISARHRVRLLFPLAGAGIAARPDGIKSAEELIREGGLVDVPAATPTPDAVVPQAVDLGGQLTLSLPERVGRIRDDALAFLHRSSSSDVANSIGMASTGGGGRVATIATLIGFCVSGVGAGALCVATGVVHVPGWIVPGKAEPTKPHTTPRAHKPLRGRAKLAATARTTEAIATTTPAPTRTPAPRRRERATHRSPAKDPSQGTTPTSHESAPIAELEQHSVAEFSIEQSATSAPRQPDPPPPTGGGEFTP